MGQIIAPFGVKGWVKLKVYTETPESLLDYPTWWLRTGNSWQEYSLEEGESRSSGLVARLAGCDDRSAAESLKSMEVGVPRDAFPAADDGEFYWADLIGLAVVNMQDELLGSIKELIETGANDVLVVQGADRQRLIPYIASVIVEVDLPGRCLRVDWVKDY
jgi:16S rRNA processing protein RimM